MSRSVFLFPRMRQSISRELLKIFHSRGKTFSQLISPQQLCSFCCLQHHRLMSSKQTPLHRPTTVDATDALKRENRSSSVEKSELDGVGSSAWQQPNAWLTEFHRPAPQLNWDYLCNPDNRDFIRENIVNRKGVGDIDRVVSNVNVRRVREDADLVMVVSVEVNTCSVNEGTYL